MKRILSILCICLLSSVWMQAQSLKNLFVNMPDTLSLIMTSVNRADCVDFLASKMKARVTNRFNNESEVETLTDDYLLAQVTKSSKWEMKRLPLNDSVAVICFVKTVKAPVEDSHIRFYSTDWKELPTRTFLPNSPKADDFFMTPSVDKTDSLKELRAKADITFMKAQLNKDSETLTFIYTTPEYMNRDDAKKMSVYLRPSPIVYEWREGKFVRMKD